MSSEDYIMVTANITKEIVIALISEKVLLEKSENDYPTKVANVYGKIFDAVKEKVK